MERELDTPRSQCTKKMHLSRRLDVACLLKALPCSEIAAPIFFSSSSSSSLGLLSALVSSVK